jgi:hypothetical protein
MDDKRKRAEELILESSVSDFLRFPGVGLHDSTTPSPIYEMLDGHDSLRSSEASSKDSRRGLYNINKQSGEPQGETHRHHLANNKNEKMRPGTVPSLPIESLHTLSSSTPKRSSGGPDADVAVCTSASGSSGGREISTPTTESSPLVEGYSREETQASTESLSVGDSERVGCTSKLEVGDSGGKAPRQLPTATTVSCQKAPGPYHNANVMLRKQLPHYEVHVPRCVICATVHVFFHANCNALLSYGTTCWWSAHLDCANMPSYLIQRYMPHF